MAKKISSIDDNDDTILTEDDNELREHEKKIERFFNDFNNIESFKIVLYKKDPTGKKRTIVTEFIDRRPDIINDIQQIYGGGSYEMYASKIRPDGKTEFLDTVTFNLSEPINGVEKQSTTNDDEAENRLLQRMSMMKEIISGNQNNGIDMLKMLEMMNTFNMQMMNAQQKSEERFNSMMLEIVKAQNKGSSIDDFMKMFSLAKEMIPASDEGPSNIISTLAPFAPAINSVIQQQIQQRSPKVNGNKRIMPAVTMEKMSVEQVRELLTPEIRAAITPEKKESAINYIYKKLQGKADREIIIQAIENE